MRRWERAISTLFLSVALLLVSGCGGGGGTTPPPPPGSAPMTLFVRDAGAEKLLAFEIQLTGAALVSGTTEQSILAAPVELELKNLQLATMPLSLNNVREGTYTTLRLTFANPEATVLTSTPTVVKCETGAACVPTLAAGPLNKTVNITVQLNLRSAVIIDFDLAASVNVTENPLAVSVNPAVNVTQVPVQAPQQAEAELEDVVGTVTAIDGANQSFTFRPEGMTATFNIVTNAQTKFEDFDDASPARANAFASIRVNDLVEVDAEQRADGGFVAEEVELAEAEDDNRVELEGLITSVDPVAGTVKIVIRERRRTTTLQSELGREITLDVRTANFRINKDDLTIIDTLFDDLTDAIPGQFVEAELSAGTTVRRLTLKKATYQGRVTGPPAGNNFPFEPDLALIVSIVPIQVFTFPGVTEFRDGLTSIGDVQSAFTVAVRGLLVKQPSGAIELYARRVGKVQ